ncbi:DUF3488 and transglutaminase-like domain-containing protein [Streptomyces capparidis]
MSGQIRLTLCAALASVLTACALLPLVGSSSWLAQAVALVVAQALVGAVARRVPLPQPVTILVQLATVLVLFVLAFAREQAPLGLLPGPEAMAHLRDLLDTGVNDVSEYQTPAPLTDGIQLLLVGGVVLIAVVVDALAVTFRSAASAGLPLLGLYSVAAGLAPEDEGSRWLWFTLAAAGYLALLLAEGRDRLSRWGRVFSAGPQRDAQEQLGLLGGLGGGPRTPAVRAGRRIAGVTLGLALVVPLALPSLGDGVIGPDAAGGGSGVGGSPVAVNPLVSMQDSLNQPENREVLKYRTSAQSNSEMYLRIVALDEFDGAAWRMPERAGTVVPDQLPPPEGLSEGVKRTRINTSLSTAGWYRQESLPMPFPAMQVAVDGSWSYDPVSRALVGDRGQSAAGLTYQVSSLVVEPTAEQLAGAPAPRQVIADRYTQVPESLPDGVAAEAQRITATAVNDYERAMALQEWFTGSGGFTYDTRVRSGTGTGAITRFLQDKRGFCVHFAFTMAAMSRTLGIPARVAVGYVPGTPDPSGAYSVGLKDAHAWPELYFEGAGWVRFEPTPARGNTPGYAERQISEDNAAVPPVVPTPTPSASTGPSAQPVCDARAQRAGECSTEDPRAAGGSGGGGSDDWPVVAATATGVALLAGLPLLPLLWRLRTRRVRLGAGGLAAWQELLDTAWDLGVPPRASETPRRAAERLVTEGRLTGEAAQTARRVARAVEQMLYAPVPVPAAGLTADVRALLAALRGAAQRGARVRAVLLPRSAARVSWALTVRWAALTARYSAAVRRLPLPGRSG